MVEGSCCLRVLEALSSNSSRRMTLGRFWQANNCSLPVGRRILYCYTIQLFKYYNFLSLNISINLYWYQLMTQVYAMIYILMKQAQDASNNNFSPEKRIRYRGMQAKRRISRRICLSCWTTFCKLVIVGQTEKINLCANQILKLRSRYSGSLG